jgi:hypothetical protein
MKKLLLAILLVMFLVAPCMADDVTLKWDAASGTSTYKIKMSLDNCVTWDTGVLTGALTPDGNNEVVYVYSGVTSAIPVHFMVITVVNGFDGPPINAGAWYFGDMELPPLAPDQVGVSGVTD